MGTGLHKETIDTSRCSKSLKSAMDFPRELIEELFMRLPVKQLVRFKCLSKDWNDFISDISFRKRYHSRQKTKCSAPAAGFICHANMNSCSDRYDLRWYDPCYIRPGAIRFWNTSENHVEKDKLRYLDYLNQFGYVVAVSKSLLLVCHDPRILYVCDLVSKKHVNLPITLFLVGDHIALGFKCEEKFTQKNGGLCYTVICVSTPHKSLHKSMSRFDVKIYSSETGIWKDSTMISKKSTFRVHPKYIAKVIRGVFHWHDPDSDHIIAYNSDDPKGRTVVIECPSTDLFLEDRERLTSLESRKDGSLQFIGIEGNKVNVWIMTCGQNYMDEEDEIVDLSRWSFACSVICSDIEVDYLMFSVIQYFIGVDPADADVIYLRGAGGQIYAYNHQQQKVVFTSSHVFPPETSVFTHFEWPVWPCL